MDIIDVIRLLLLLTSIGLLFISVINLFKKRFSKAGKFFLYFLLCLIYRMMICSDIRILFILKWALFVLSVVLTLVLVVIAFKKRNEKVCSELFISKICLPYPLVIGVIVAGIICLIIFFIFFEVVD
ncbi:hypothetical protein ES705_06823 [subsurface metagenome]